MSELYSSKEYNISSRNKLSTIQDSIKEIKINELKDFSLNDSNFKSIKNEIQIQKSEENSLKEIQIKRKCQSFVDNDSKDLMKK